MEIEAKTKELIYYSLINANRANSAYCDLIDLFFKQKIGEQINFENLISQINEINNYAINLHIEVKSYTSDSLKQELGSLCKYLIDYLKILIESCSSFLYMLKKLNELAEGNLGYKKEEYKDDVSNLEELENKRQEVGKILQNYSSTFLRKYNNIESKDSTKNSEVYLKEYEKNSSSSLEQGEYKKIRSRQEKSNSLEGLGGWLILFQIRIILSIVLSVYYIFLYSWANIQISITTLIFLQLILLVLTIISFYKKKIIFRIYYSVFFVLSIILIIVLIDYGFDAYDIGSDILYSLIWVIYLFASKRVKYNFVEKKA